MLVKNPARRPVQHSFYNDKNELEIIEIQGGEIKEIDDKIAEFWLKHGFVVEYVEPKKAREEKDELLAKIAKLEAENAALKEEKELVYVEEEQAIMTKKEANKTTKKGK